MVSRSVLLSSRVPSLENQRNSVIPSYEFGAAVGKQDRPKVLPLKGSSESNGKIPSPSNNNGAAANGGGKMSLTSSSDSISSSASVNTVKSVSPVDKDDTPPPSLPPRTSPVKPSPPSAIVGSPKPALPVRTNKLSPVKHLSPQRTLPKAPPPAVPAKASQKRTVVRIKENGVSYPAQQHEENPPALPEKTLNMADRLAGGSGRRLPAAPHANGGSSDKVNGFVLANGHEPSEIYSNSEFDPDDSSLEGTSVDDEDDSDGSGRVMEMKMSNPAFRKAEHSLQRIVGDIQASKELCRQSGGRRNRETFESAKENLTGECRHFVTASKLFVKSATESEQQMTDCLSHCLSMLDRVSRLARECGESTPPESANQAAQLMAKLADVAVTFLMTVRAASQVVSSSEDHRANSAAMAALMKGATSLASVLTTLMRMLRVF